MQIHYFPVITFQICSLLHVETKIQMSYTRLCFRDVMLVCLFLYGIKFEIKMSVQICVEFQNDIIENLKTSLERYRNSEHHVKISHIYIQLLL
jgi:hypothetical protein